MALPAIRYIDQRNTYTYSSKYARRFQRAGTPIRAILFPFGDMGGYPLLRYKHPALASAAITFARTHSYDKSETGKIAYRFKRRGTPFADMGTLTS